METYNCAGLAFRTYEYLGDVSEIKDFLEANNRGSEGQVGDVQFVLWEYNLYASDKNGKALSETSSDFHIVAGVITQNGVEPTNVYSKNGARPVFGPSEMSSWKPEKNGSGSNKQRFQYCSQSTNIWRYIQSEGQYGANHLLYSNEQNS